MTVDYLGEMGAVVTVLVILLRYLRDRICQTGKACRLAHVSGF